MFRCKSCGRQFGANTPEACPDCGAPNRQPDSAGSKRFWALVLLGGGIELLIFAILVGVVIALAIKHL